MQARRTIRQIECCRNCALYMWLVLAFLIRPHRDRHPNSREQLSITAREPLPLQAPKLLACRRTHADNSLAPTILRIERIAHAPSTHTAPIRVVALFPLSYVGVHTAQARGCPGGQGRLSLGHDGATSRRISGPGAVEHDGSTTAFRSTPHASKRSRQELVSSAGHRPLAS